MNDNEIPVSEQLEKYGQKAKDIIKTCIKFIGKTGFSLGMYIFICSIYLGIYHLFGFEQTLIILLIGIFNSGIVNYAFGKKG